MALFGKLFKNKTSATGFQEALTISPERHCSNCHHQNAPHPYTCEDGRASGDPTWVDLGDKCVNWQVSEVVNSTAADNENLINLGK